MSETEEIAKATAEVAKLGTQAFQTLDKLGEFVSRLFGDFLTDAVGIVADRLKFFRWQRQMRLIDEVNRELAARNVVQIRPVAPKLGLPLLEAASLEEDDELQDLWIRLLANAMDPSFHGDLRYSYLEILKSLTPLDAKFLNVFYTALKNDPNIDLNTITEYALTKEQLCQELNISLAAYYLSIYNLFRVQCMAPAIIRKGMHIGDDPITIYKGADAVVMTPLGRSFVEACIRSR